MMTARNMTIIMVVIRITRRNEGDREYLDIEETESKFKLNIQGVLQLCCTSNVGIFSTFNTSLSTEALRCMQ
jgi:hypothetical protein